MALVHYAVFTVSFVQSEVVASATPQPASRVLSGVLGFPLAYLAELIPRIDIFPIAVFANSVLWGIGSAAIAMTIKRSIATRS